MSGKTPKTTKQPAAQVEPARKAAALKAAAEAKRPQPAWLRGRGFRLPPADEPLPSSPERVNAAHQSQGPPRLIDKAEIRAITGVSFPTIWHWMRAGKFPRSREVGGKSMWLSTDIADWMAALPLRALKGDEPPEAA